MSKTLNLNHQVHIKLTEVGIQEYLKEYPWKTDAIEKARANGMWLREQMWVVLATFNSFANGGFTPSFTEIVIGDSLLEDKLLPLEDVEIEKLAVFAFDTWIGNKYTNEVWRREEKNGYITVGVDIVPILTYKPSGIPGLYHLKEAIGVTYPLPDNKTRTLRQLKNLLLRNVKAQPERFAKGPGKIISDIYDWCDGRNYTKEGYESLVRRVNEWGTKPGSKKMKEALKAATELWEKFKPDTYKVSSGN